MSSSRLIEGPARVHAFFVAMLFAAACASPAPQDLSDFRLHSTDSIVEARDAESVLIAFYSDWQILGAEAFDDLQPGFRSMADAREPLDHPLLGVWQDRLSDLQDLVVEPDATAWEIGRVGSGLPFEAAVDDAVLLYVGSDARRAALALDQGDGLGISRTSRFQLLDVALSAPDLDDNRAAEWMRTFVERDNIPAVHDLAMSASFGPRAATAGMFELDRFDPADRLVLYLLFAQPLVDRPGRANLLVDSLTALPRPQRGGAAARLLEGGSPQLHLVMVERLAELPEHERLDLLTAVVRGPRFVGEIQAACVRAAQALPEPMNDLARAEIAASGRLEPATRELLIR